jgi:hypothetical protein
VADVIAAAEQLASRCSCAVFKALSEISKIIANLRCIEAPDAALLLDLLAQVLGFKTN